LKENIRQQNGALLMPQLRQLIVIAGPNEA